MTRYFITRHLGAAAWAEQNHVHFDLHLTHLNDIEALQKNDMVIGTLPINIVAILNRKGIRYVHLSLKIPAELRGIELTAQQLDACQATLEEFEVKQKPFSLFTKSANYAV